MNRCRACGKPIWSRSRTSYCDECFAKWKEVQRIDQEKAEEAYRKEQRERGQLEYD